MAPIQTPQMRKANQKFAKSQDVRRGQPESAIKSKEKRQFKSPVSPMWIGILAFILFGGIAFELIRLFF